MSEIEHYHQPPTTQMANPVSSIGRDLIRENAEVLGMCKQLADAVAKTSMMPKHLRGKPEEAAAVMLYGASLGLDPMQAVRQIYEVHGQPGLYARSMDALVKAAGHQTWTVESTDASVTVAGQRRGSSHVETATWTIQRAQKAGYTENAKYKSDPQAMLRAKALAEVCRRIAPDVLNGVYGVEELQLERWDAEVVDVKRTDPGGLAAALNPSPPQADANTDEATAEGQVNGSEANETAESTESPESSESSEPVDAEPMFDYRSSWARTVFFPALRAAEESGQFTNAHEFMSEIAERDIRSSKDLTEVEAHRVFDHLPQQEAGQ